MLQQRKKKHPTLCYMSAITDEQSAVYTKHNVYSQDFRTTPYLYRTHRHVMENETVFRQDYNRMTNTTK